MKRHTEMFHNNDTVGNLPKEKKRQRSSYTCLSCNSTFTSNYMRNKHVKEQHEGKNILSPERKIARKDVDNEQTTEQIKEDIVTIPLKELEDLQDLLVQTGKEKEALNEKIEAINIRMYDIEKENCNLKQETKYLKSENEKANGNINKLDNLYQIRVTELKKSAEQHDTEMKIVKDQLEKHLKVKPQAEVDQKEVAREGHQENTKGNHEVTYTIKCRECDFSGRTQNELDEHHRNDCSEALIQRLVEEENGFVCQLCEMDFSGRTQNEWEQHLQNNCSGFVCQTCGLTRKTQHNMEKHMEYHANDEQDTDWSNEEEPQVEERHVAHGHPEEEQEVTGEPEEAWQRIKKHGLATGGQVNSTGPFGGLGLCSSFSLPHCHHHGPVGHGGDPFPAEGAPGCPEPKTSPACPTACDAQARPPFDDFSSYRFRFDGYVQTYDNDADTIALAILRGGPVTASFDVYEDFEDYVGGIYVVKSKVALGGHAVRIVGWGTEAGVPYWKVANSWNRFWGEQGYFRIRRGTDEAGIEASTMSSAVDLTAWRGPGVPPPAPPPSPGPHPPSPSPPLPPAGDCTDQMSRRNCSHTSSEQRVCKWCEIGKDVGYCTRWTEGCL